MYIAVQKHANEILDFSMGFLPQVDDAPDTLHRLRFAGSALPGRSRRRSVLYPLDRGCVRDFT
jgi:hypothetical protein